MAGRSRDEPIANAMKSVIDVSLQEAEGGKGRVRRKRGAGKKGARKRGGAIYRESGGFLAGRE